MPSPPAKAQPQTRRDVAGWAFVGLLLLGQYVLFREFVTREISWAYPAHHDQIVYLGQAYDTYEHILDYGLLTGVRYGLHLGSPNGSLIHVEAALLFLATGANRLGALTLHFVHFALLQLALVATLRWLTRRWDAALAGLGLLLCAVSTFMPLGGISDFRLDFIALCQMGVLLCLVVRSGAFASRSWSLAVGGAVIWLGVMRFITLVYLTGIVGLLLPWFAGRWLRRRGPERQLERCRLVNTILASLLVLVVVLPVVWKKRAILEAYYVFNHLIGEQKVIFGQKSGLWYVYYPESLIRDHAGTKFLVLAGAALALAGLVRLVRLARRVPAEPDARLNLRVLGTVLAISLFVPLAILSLGYHRTNICAGIALPALLWLVLLLVVGGTGLHPGALLGWPLRALLGTLAALSVAAGVHHQAWWYGHRTPFTAQRADNEEILRLHDHIEDLCTEHGWQQPVFAVTCNLDFLHPQVSQVLMYERHHSRRQVQAQLGMNVITIRPEEALAQAAASDLVLLAPPRVITYPFEHCMADLYPQLRRLCEEHFIAEHTYRIRGQDVTLYVRPALRVTDPPTRDWVGTEGFRLEGPAGALRGCKSVVLVGAADCAGLGGSPTARAELRTPGCQPQPVPVDLVVAGDGYRLKLDCAGIANVYDGPVEVCVMLDCSALPASAQGAPSRFLRTPHEIITYR